MTDANFFGMASISESLFWVGVFFLVVIIGAIWHFRAKKKLAQQSKKS